MRLILMTHFDEIHFDETHFDQTHFDGTYFDETHIDETHFDSYQISVSDDSRYLGQALSFFFDQVKSTNR